MSCDTLKKELIRSTLKTSRELLYSTHILYSSIQQSVDCDDSHLLLRSKEFMGELGRKLQNIAKAEIKTFLQSIGSFSPSIKENWNTLQKRITSKFKGRDLLETILELAEEEEYSDDESKKSISKNNDSKHERKPRVTEIANSILTGPNLNWAMHYKDRTGFEDNRGYNLPIEQAILTGPARIDHPYREKMDNLFYKDQIEIVSGVTGLDFQGNRALIALEKGGFIEIDTSSGDCICEHNENSEIKSICYDSLNNIIYSTFKNEVYSKGRSSIKSSFISSQRLSDLPRSSFILKESNGQLIIVTDRYSISSFSATEQGYISSSYLQLSIPEQSGEIIQILPGKQLQTKVLILTRLGKFIHIGEDGGFAQINFHTRGRLYVIY